MTQIVNEFNEVNWRLSKAEVKITNYYVKNAVSIIGQQRNVH